MDGLQEVVDEVSTSVYLNQSHDYILVSYFTISLDFHIPFQYIFVSDALLFSHLQEYKILKLHEAFP